MSSQLAESILAACRKALPPERPLALHEPDLGELEQRYLEQCLRSGWVSTAGHFVERFEAQLCARTGARHAIATINGTAALHAALLVAGVRPGDEVLVPSLTFVATANAVTYCSAVPHFIEVSPATLGVDAAALDAYLDIHARTGDGVTVSRVTGRPLRALIVMHAFGHPADMDSLLAVAARWNLVLVEDAAESLGSTYRGRHAGTMGAVGVLSFNGNKTVTTGGGGAILTDAAALATKARHLCSTARIDAGWNFIHDAVGFNYRMPSLNAALGLAQLERLGELLTAKERLARRYAAAFAGVAGARLFVPAAHVRSNHWLNTLILDDASVAVREEVLACLASDAIHARPAWVPMHRLPMYANCPRMPLGQTDRLVASLINLPSSPRLGGNVTKPQAAAGVHGAALG
jgi:perosamine synthetase